MIRYFVSYSHDRGFGCTEIRMPHPVRSLKEIDLIADLIEESRSTRSVVVLNFQRFEDAIEQSSTTGVPS